MSLSKSQKFVVVSLCLTLLAGMGFAQKLVTLQVKEGDSAYIKGAKPMFAVIPRVNETPAANQPDVQVPIFTKTFRFNGTTFTYHMVGTDPAAGSATSNIPLVIIPLKFHFSDGTNLSASQTVCGDSKNTKFRVKNSPIIKKATFTPGGTNVGTTQYVDAFQRANFWNFVSTTAPNYHVLLSPVSTKPLQTINVTVANGSTQAGPCARIGTVDINFFDTVAMSLLTTLNIPANTLPLFLSYNTFETSGGGCCILGYHSTNNLGTQAYAVAAYSDPGIFSVPIQDIHALSHEVGEWMDDPLIPSQNIVPAWGHVGQVSGCQNNLENGDPVTGKAFTISVGGTAPFTYHPEDLVFLPWFARITPSTSVNGWFTFLNGFSAPQAVCH
ncbi:MAG: hypothetical protein DMG80_17780 [Acidobacteria bacterium]|nr:MAG: hypothetical protein DMG80_17780 [Acidobacteriota bacterium]